MIKKQVLVGNTVKEVGSNLLELEYLVRQALLEATYVKHIIESSMDERGMCVHSVNKINIDDSNSFSVNCSGDNLVITVGDYDYSIAINEDCNILIQRPNPCENFRILFKDFQQFLTIG